MDSLGQALTPSFWWVFTHGFSASDSLQKTWPLWEKVFAGMLWTLIILAMLGCLYGLSRVVKKIKKHKEK